MIPPRVKPGHDRLDRRRAGVVLHPTSLPGPQSVGNLGQAARDFIHFLADCGLSLWQMLPLGPTHLDGSPYQCLSTHAGNPLLIDLEWLVHRGWLKADELGSDIDAAQQATLLQQASQRFYQSTDPQWQASLQQFLERNQHWLPDYALYLALKRAYNQLSWQHWPEIYRLRDDAAIESARERFADEIRSAEFIQFVFFEQWHELREYANKQGILLFGDMPIYVPLDSADVWAERENFLIDPHGDCTQVAGVPPDAFSDTGQLWGNPLYDWDYMQQQGFDWWIKRVDSQLQCFDYLRIDHFRALQSYWQIPAQAETAAEGQWVDSPGDALLERLHDHFDALPLIAEDLGMITPEVRQLRDHFHLPGMAVLQFAFDGDNGNLYLPHNHQHNSVVYTGTHDNDTSLGWYHSLEPYARAHLNNYLGQSETSSLDMPWTLNRMALASVADFAILPMQDLLSLDSSHRMNTPGTTSGNWSWRFDWSWVWPNLAHDLRQLLLLYGRI